MRTLHWAAAGFLVLVLLIGIGLIVAFVLDATSVVGIVVGASLAVSAWHGLRSIEPRSPEARPPEGWSIAVLNVAACSSLLLLALWNPWLLVFGMLVIPLWWRLTRHQ